MGQVRKFLKKVIYAINKPYMRVLPGQLAFFTVLSLIPLVALIGSIASYFSISLNSFDSIFKSFLPTDVSQIFTTSMPNKGLTFNMVIFLISAFILASNGSHSIIITSNEIYGIKGRGFLGRRIKAICITFLLVCVVMFTLLVPVFGDIIFKNLNNMYGNIFIIKFCYNLFCLIKIPITMLIMFYTVKLIYTMAPDETVNNNTNWGPLFTTVLWIIGTLVYSIYVRDFAHYNLFYGSISNLIILLIWVYYLAYVFVLGMAISVTGDKDLDLTKKIELDNKK